MFTQTTEELFAKYLEYGGLPFLPQVKYDAKASRIYLDDLYWAILSKDVMRRLQIRDVDLLDRIVRYVISEIGHVFSARNIVRFLKSEHRTTTVETVLTHLRACEDAFLFSKVPREDLIGKHVLSIDEKYYISDLGMRRAIVGDLHGGDVDQLLESLVYREMIRRGWTVTSGRVREKEVDFVCQNHDERLYIRHLKMAARPLEPNNCSSILSLPPKQPSLLLCKHAIL